VSDERIADDVLFVELLLCDGAFLQREFELAPSAPGKHLLELDELLDALGGVGGVRKEVMQRDVDLDHRSYVMPAAIERASAESTTEREHLVRKLRKDRGDDSAQLAVGQRSLS
jgi:hypothetical protein